MKVKILNQNKIREGVPIHVEIYQATSMPKVNVENLGEVEAKKATSGYLAEFWTMKEGKYNISITDSKDSWNGEIIVGKQTYLDFQSEFTFFLILLFFSLIGVAIWMRKNRKT